MTAFWQFADQHPLVTLCALWLIVWLLAWPFRLINRWIRHRNIAARGWPENPLMDADGDIVYPADDGL